MCTAFDAWRIRYGGNSHQSFGTFILNIDRRQFVCISA